MAPSTVSNDINIIYTVTILIKVHCLFCDCDFLIKFVQVSSSSVTVYVQCIYTL